MTWVRLFLAELRLSLQQKRLMDLLKIKLSEIMTNRPLTLHPKDKIQRAIDLFEDLDIHHIPIVVMSEVVGIISEGDILFASESYISNSFQEFLRERKLSIDAVEEVMTSPVICVQQDQTLDDALEIMLSRRINALPVLEEKTLVGLVTTYDILKSLKKQAK